jgi:hypothetical protein
MFRTALACLIVCLTTGCASIVNGHNQSVTVTTRANGADLPGGKCTLTNDKGKWYTATPGSVVVRRSYGELAVNCAHDAHEAANQSFKSATKAMAFGNAIFGGVIGVAVDVSTGAAYDYPDLLQVTFGGLNPTQGSALAPAAVMTAKAPVAASSRIGTRYVLRELDVISGAPTGGESILTLTALSATDAEFNDGAFMVSLTGQAAKPGGASIVGIRLADLVPQARTSASFLPSNGAESAPLELNVVAVETLPDSMGALRVARVQVSGFSVRSNLGGGYPNSPIAGDAMIDLDTGLVISAHVKSRANNFTMRRELVRVSRPVVAVAAPT